MNLITYIEKYGNKTFAEKELNEVDKLILGNLSYVNYRNIISKNSFRKTRMEEVGNIFFNNNYDKGKKILAVKGGIKLLKAMYKTNRYKDLLLFNYERIINDKEQFSALSIEINSKLVYVSFEGTNEAVVGWKEDFEMCFMFPVKAQRSAINYLNKHFTFKNYRIIVGGHSKGGNLALIAAMYTNFIVRNKIIEAYSYDGPGITLEMVNSSRFNKIKDRFKHIIPNNSAVGVILYSNNYRVIKTNHVGILSHYALNWLVNDSDLIDDKLKASSIELKDNINAWIDKYTYEEKEQFVNELFKILNKNDITSLFQIVNKPIKILNLLNKTANVNSKTNKMFKEFVSMVKSFLLKNIREKVTKK